MIEAESKLDETMEVKPESVELTTEPEINEAELDSVAEFMPDETPVVQQRNIKRKKSNHRILPPLRKLRQTPRIRVVRFYTETASGFRIGVDCVSFDLA